MRQAHNASGSSETRRRTGGERGCVVWRRWVYRCAIRFLGRYIARGFACCEGVETCREGSAGRDRRIEWLYRVYSVVNSRTAV